MQCERSGASGFRVAVDAVGALLVVRSTQQQQQQRERERERPNRNSARCCTLPIRVDANLFSSHRNDAISRYCRRQPKARHQMRNDDDETRALDGEKSKIVLSSAPLFSSSGRVRWQGLSCNLLRPFRANREHMSSFGFRVCSESYLSKCSINNRRSSR